MADDARISTALPRHPKTVKLQRRLGAPGCWSLVCLFLWVAENRPTGDLEGMSGEDIEIAATWPGAIGDFVRALVEVRFMDGQECAYKLHDWAEHNPWVATRPQRTESARKAAAVRWEKKRTASARNAAECEPHETAMPSSPLHVTPSDTRKPNLPYLENCLIHSKEKNYSQSDFDEEAYRLFAKAGRELDLKIAGGLVISQEEAFKYQSAKAGKSPQRMSEILARVEGASA